MNTNKTLRILPIILLGIAVAFIVGLAVVISLLTKNLRPIDIPELEIVYSKTYYPRRDDALWFINSEGQNQTSIEVPKSRSGGTLRPIFTEENALCAYTGVFSPRILSTIQDGDRWRSHLNFEPELLSLTREYSSVYDSPYIILIHQNGNYTGRLITVDYKNETVISDHPFSGQEYEWRVLDLGVNAQHGDTVVYTRIKYSPTLNSELVLWNLATNNERVIVATEGYVVKDASFSPDGMQLVYYDSSRGIVVLHLSEEQPRDELLLAYRQNDQAESFSDESPEPSWSPDGEWIVYHRQIDPTQLQSVGISNYGIYKLNLDTKEEVLLVEGGVYPFWRHDVSVDIE